MSEAHGNVPGKLFLLNKNFWIDIKFNFKTIWANLLFYSKFYYEIYLIVVDFIEFYPAGSTKF
jgi:hypothetical protein